MFSQTIYPGPTPPYTNLPINAQFYKPSTFYISNISLGIMTIITTSTDHNYVIGQLVSLVIPSNYGSYQLNGQLAFVIGIPTSNQVILDLNSTNVDPFISSPAFIGTPPQIVAIGDINSGLISSTGRVNPNTAMPGSFQNISPK